MQVSITSSGVLDLFCCTSNMAKFIYSALFLIVGICCATSMPDGASTRSSSVTTPSLIRKHGYPIEEHSVQTSDGYILTMHRIPYSPKLGSGGPQRPVAFLMHGLLCSSSDWVLNGPGRALAYILSDAGYDVWMGNARGNTYSRKHASKSPALQPFWNFDWHEIGIYDLPAMIDYVLYRTDKDDLRYFGHSQGTTAFFVLNSMIPRFKNRIRSAHLLAPVAFMGHMESPLAKVAAPLMGQPNAFVELFGSAEFLPNTKAMELLGSLTCRDKSPVQAVCSNVLFLLAGWDSPYLNETMIPEITATTPAGCSINQLQHYLQEYNSDRFCQFDYGSIRNKNIYGTKKPTAYNIDNINVPIYMYYSDNDYFASLVDVNRMILALNKKALRRAYRLPYPKWNHLDFLWGLNVEKLLYSVVMEDVRNS